jgi:excisionase family DNA binding protein
VSDGPRLVYSVGDAARQLGVSRSTLFVLVKNNELASIKVHTRRLIAHADLVDYIRLHRINEREDGAHDTDPRG